MQIEVHDKELKKVGNVDLPDDVFGVETKTALLWETVKQQTASRRRGTHATKDRAQVSGTGAKPLKQKGTGSARQGSRRSPQFVGGGMAMGPRPRSYAYRLPRSARRAALRSALSVRVADKNMLVLSDFSMDTPKTKTVAEFLGKLGTKSVLLVDVDNGNLRKSAKNLPKSKFVPADGLNVYDILNHEKLVVTQAALEPIVAKAKKAARLAEGQGGES